ncbi:MAG: prepilin peptidase [Anaerolineales bacterium]|nr:prepilin peptidase [Anaerolineales bacterium]MCK5634741.1 prepilin peptidase [Anaerolineales bacterium]
MIIAIAILGWIFGVVINWLADSLPFFRKPAVPRCPACSAPFSPIAWFAIPAVIARAWRCEYCGTRRQTRTLLVELLASAGSIGLYFWSSSPASFWMALIVSVVFLLIIVIDMEHKLILHVVTFPAAIVFVLLGIFNPEMSIGRTLLGGAVGFGLFFLLYLLGGVFARSIAGGQGNDDDEVALGFGDVTLATIIGLAVGFPGVIEALLRGILAAGLFSIAYLIFMKMRRRYSAFTPIPYGPFLVLGAWWVYFLGTKGLEIILGM